MAAHLLAEVVLVAFPEYAERGAINEDTQRIVITLERQRSVTSDPPSVESVITSVVGSQGMQDHFVSAISKNATKVKTPRQANAFGLATPEKLYHHYDGRGRESASTTVDSPVLIPEVDFDWLWRAPFVPSPAFCRRVVGTVSTRPPMLRRLRP